MAHIFDIAHVETNGDGAAGLLGLLENGAGALSQGKDVAIGGVPTHRDEALHDDVEGGDEDAQ